MIQVKAGLLLTLILHGGEVWRPPFSVDATKIETDSFEFQPGTKAQKS